MNQADLARLELAKRAYRAAEPSAAEVQKGVRRARLALRRPKERRRWLGKGLVMVVLAVGGLAYAKPHAVGQLLQWPSAQAPSQVAERALSRPTPTVVVESRAPEPSVPPAPAAVHAEPEPVPSERAVPAAKVQPVELAPPTKRAQPAPPRAEDAAPASSAASVPEPNLPAAEADGAASAVSGWGRVGQALARGDEAQALSVLGELAQSPDTRTRNKAELGRAQLLMARGDREGACRVARALTQRSAGGSIDRQAQAVLKSCSR